MPPKDINLKIQEIRDALPKMEGFIDKHFPKTKPVLLASLDQGDYIKARRILNEIWFYLPDGQFNIKENPLGFSELLSLIED